MFPPFWFVSFACECRTFYSHLKVLHVNVGPFLYVLPEAEKLNELNDQ